MKSTFLAAIFLISISVQAKIRVAVTVDDLPKHSSMPVNASRLVIVQKMIDALKRQSVPEVYGFVNVNKLEDEKGLSDILNLWVANGYPLGNHTFSHQSINKISSEDFKQDISLNENKLQLIGGKYDWKYFRYPFLHEGNTLEKRNAIRSYLKEKNYKIAQVTIDFEDWSWNEPFARCSDKNDLKQIQWLKETYLKNSIDHLHRAEILSKALFQRSIAHILLLHIGAFDSEIIEELINAYKKEGVEFIPLSEAVKDEVYSFDPAVTWEYGAEFTYQVLKSRGLKLKDVGLQPYDQYPKERLNSLCK